MEKTFPIEDVISFTNGRIISVNPIIDALDPQMFLYQIGRFILRVDHLKPYDLLDRADEICDLIYQQHSFLKSLVLDEPKGGWSSLADNPPAVKQYVNELHLKLKMKTIKLSSP